MSPRRGLLAVAVLMLIACEDIDERVTEKHPTGQKSGQGGMKNGLRQGEWTEWNRTGKRRSEGRYQLGERDGLWVEWYENKRWAEYDYDQGRLLAKRTFHHSSKEKAAYEDARKSENVRTWRPPIVRTASNLTGLLINIAITLLYLLGGTYFLGWRPGQADERSGAENHIMIKLWTMFGGAGALGMLAFAFLGLLSLPMRGAVVLAIVGALAVVGGVGGVLASSLGGRLGRVGALWSAAAFYILAALVFTAHEV